MNFDTFKGVLGVDIETASLVDIKVGAWAYSQHESTVVLCLVFCYSEGKDYPKRYIRWEPKTGASDPKWSTIPPKFFEFIRADGRLLAHNQSFEISIWKNILLKHGFPEVPDDQWIDTQPMGFAINLPAALGGLAEALGCPIQKDEDGSKLMKKMAKEKAKPDGEGGFTYPLRDDVRKRNRLARYCADDVGAMLDCYWRLPKLSVTEALILRKDVEINNRGVYLDQEFSDACARVAEERRQELDYETFDITSGQLSDSRSPAALKTWLKDEGVELPLAIRRKKQEDGSFKTTKSETTDKAAVLGLLKDGELTDDARTVLTNRVEANKVTSLGKLRNIPLMVGTDGRLKNHLAYSIAHTGRWSSYGLQVHNLAKDKMDRAVGELVRYALSIMDLRLLKMVVERPLDAISQCIRSCVIAPGGFELIAGDWSAIEARIIAWLAGQEDVVELFRTGKDVYVHTAKNVDRPGCEKGYTSGCRCVTCETDRQLGKVLTLGLGFGMGALKLVDTGAKAEIFMPNKQWWSIHRGWRKTNSDIVSFWHVLEEAVRCAIEDVGTVFEAGPHIRVKCSKQCLFVLLPSGRQIRFWKPRIVSKTRKIEILQEDGSVLKHEIETEEIQFKTPSGGRMMTESTYGGKLAENVTQAIARDLLGETIIRMPSAYPIVMHVHDSIAAQVVKGQGSVEEFCEIMEVMPSWACGLPMKAEGYRDVRFRG